MFNCKALKKWRNRCSLTQEDVANALNLAERTSITTYENGRVNIGCNNLGLIIDLFAKHLTAHELNEFITELFGIKVYKAPQPQNINYTKWLEDKDRIIESLEKELLDHKCIADYAKKNCQERDCPILKLIA